MTTMPEHLRDLTNRSVQNRRNALALDHDAGHHLGGRPKCHLCERLEVPAAPLRFEKTSKAGTTPRYRVVVVATGLILGHVTNASGVWGAETAGITPRRQAVYFGSRARAAGWLIKAHLPKP